jgi:hypothetical protein
MRNKILSAVFLFLFLFAAGHRAVAQSETESDTTNDNVLFEHLWSIGIDINSNGWGLSFKKGKNHTFFTQYMWEITATSYKSLKEIKSINPYYSDSKSYVYGKLNYVYFLHGGVGLQHILNTKPYWGGVQLSYLFYGGASLGLAKPIYLYIVSANTKIVQRYDPEQHFVDNIYGRAPFLTGIQYTKFYPCIYLKGGLEFEFGTHNKKLVSLETGATLDISPIGIPIMAYNPPQNFFLTVYLAVSMGKRYNK